jgi:hypothetical protein
VAAETAAALAAVRALEGGAVAALRTQPAADEDAALEQLRARLDAADRERLDGVSRALEAGQPPDAASMCWLGRTILGDHGDDFAIARAFLAANARDSLAALAAPAQSPAQPSPPR